MRILMLNWRSEIMSQIKGKFIKVAKIRHMMKRPNLIHANFAREGMIPLPYTATHVVLRVMTSFVFWQILASRMRLWKRQYHYPIPRPLSDVVIRGYYIFIPWCVILQNTALDMLLENTRFKAAGRWNLDSGFGQGFKNYLCIKISTSYPYVGWINGATSHAL